VPVTAKTIRVKIRQFFFMFCTSLNVGRENQTNKKALQALMPEGLHPVFFTLFF
jgi:hypothetical protein